MGCGKSTIGPILANVLGYDFVDLDTKIEEQVGKPVRKIFEEDGETAFRQMESSALHKTALQDRVVISLGGGALTKEENLRFSKANGTVVYIRVPVDQLMFRLKRGRIQRPLLLDYRGDPLNNIELKDRIAGMLKEREAYYLKAHIVIETGNDPVGKTVDALVDALRRHEAD